MPGLGATIAEGSRAPRHGTYASLVPESALVLDNLSAGARLMHAVRDTIHVVAGDGMGSVYVSQDLAEARAARNIAFERLRDTKHVVRLLAAFEADRARS